MRTSLGIVSLAIVAATAAACSGQSTSTPPQQASAGPAATPAAMPDRDMIVLMREQFTALDPSRAASAARAAAIKASHAPLIATLQAAKPRTVVSFELINGFATRMSQAEIDATSAKLEVLAVVPDRAIPAPKHHEHIRPGASTTATSEGTGAALCNTLEPEALQITNAAFLDPTTPQAQTVLDGNGQPVTGHGVTVGFIADGLDPTIPGFTRADGSKVFVDYQDFSGDPASLATAGGEAFGDASSIAAQDIGPNGPIEYDISAYGYSPPGLSSPCNVRIRGMAPGASLVGLKAIASNGNGSTSAVVQAVSWAVVHDHVDVLNESLGGQYVPDLTTDPFSLANAAAVRAGVTITVSSGDAGSTNTLNSPSTDPSVIASGATIQYRIYAQVGESYGSGWIDGNMAAFSSSGFAQNRPRTVDLVAPGDSGWAYCSTNSALFNDCLSFSGQPTQVEMFGGTSESAPITAGAAALVVQAYRSTHHGVSPSPALVKSILMSTSSDTGAPSDEQGAGIVNALAAVDTALSIRDGDGDPRAQAGGGPVISPNAVPLTAGPGQSFEQTFQVTNTGTKALSLKPALQQLGPAFAGQTVSVPFDAQVGYSVQTVDVPAGTDHLDVSVGYLVPAPSAQTYVGFQILDPQGRIAVDSDPQGFNSGYGAADVNAPAAGAWTVVLYSSLYTGPVAFTWAAEKYVSFGSVSPSTLSVAPGATASVTATFQAPGQPGDLAAALRFPGASIAEVPITVRTLVSLGAHGGAFTGTLTGGNARQGVFPVKTYDFDVPAGVQNLGVGITLPEAGYGVEGFLIDPNGMVLDSASNLALVTPEGGNPTLVPSATALQLQRATPQPGQWSLVLEQTQAAGNQTSVQFSAKVTLNAAVATATSLPNSAHTKVSATTGMTVTLDVTNSGVATESYFVDARLPNLTSIALPTSLCSSTTPATLPGTCSALIVPTETSALVIEAKSSAPLNMDAYPAFGTSPDVFALPVGTNTVAAFVAAPEVPYSSWQAFPSLIGPFPAAGAPTTAVTTTATALLQAFDPAVTSSAGDAWADLVNGTSTFQPLVLAPGASGQITVTLKPAASSVGRQVSGTLYVDSYNRATDPITMGDEIVALPYSYSVTK
jgi:Subtilase family